MTSDDPPTVGMAVSLTRDVPVAAGVLLLAGTRGVVDLEHSRAGHGRRYVVRFGDIQAVVFRSDISRAVPNDPLSSEVDPRGQPEQNTPVGYYRELGR
jgi:hypothetical protein